jgi:aryl-alcohol dehydrogenase-like predicted oxidoreductase
VQGTWNLLEPSAAPALAAAHAAGLGVIVKEAVANGRLTSRGDVPELIDVAARAGVSADALALGATLAQPWADVVLSGASTADMVASNLTALHVAVDPETLERLGAVAEDPNDYWERRSALSWN